MKQQKGFSLIELTLSLVLIGIVGSFTGFFLYSGFTGYLNVKKTSDGALNAQRALDRITLELRNISTISGTPSSTSITYSNEELTGTRTLHYNSNTDEILINVANTDHTLLEEVSAFSLTYSYLNLDNDPAPTDEVANIDVAFNLADIGTQFRATVFPRFMVPKTWP